MFPRPRFLVGLVTVGLAVAVMACGSDELSVATSTATPMASALALTTTTASPQADTPAGDVDAGELLFNTQGCVACHSKGDNITVGPGLSGIGGRGGGEYIRESIVDPSAVVVDGFADGLMPGDYGDKLSDQGLNDLTAYLLTLD